MEKITENYISHFICGRITFVGTSLTASVNMRPAASLLETIIGFTEYFTEKYPDKQISKLDLFLKESHMHEGKIPWQSTTFT